MCRVQPIEVMVRGGNGWRGHWRWRQIAVCADCQRVFFDLVDQVTVLEEIERDDAPSLGGRGAEHRLGRSPRLTPAS